MEQDPNFSIFRGFPSVLTFTVSGGSLSDIDAITDLDFPIVFFSGVPNIGYIGSNIYALLSFNPVGNGISLWTTDLGPLPTSLPAPTVNSIAPVSGPAAGGTAVTITGADFVAAATVSFGGVTATSVNVANETTITATTPSHIAGVVDIVVTNPDGQSGTLAGGYEYIAAPTVTSVAPNNGPTAGGEVVIITGDDFVVVMMRI